MATRCQQFGEKELLLHEEGSGKTAEGVYHLVGEHGFLVELRWLNPVQ